MRKPSVKTLESAFPGYGKALRAVFECSRDELIERYPAAAERDRTSYHPHKTYVLRLEALSVVGEFYGVDAIETESGEYAEYLNAGDTYVTTIIYWRGNYRLQSVGDFAEQVKIK